MNGSGIKRSLSLCLVTVIAGGILYFMFRSVVEDWPVISSYPWEISWLSMVCSAILAVTSMLLAIKAAHSLCTVLGGGISPVRFLYFFSIAQLGRYLPGRIWHLVSFTIFLEREGVKKAVSVVLPLLFQGIMVGVLWLMGSILSGPVVIAKVIPHLTWLAALSTIVIVLILLVLPYLSTRVGNLLSNRFREIEGIFLPRRGYFSILGLLALSGVTLSGAFFLFVSSLLEIALADAPVIGGMFLLSYVIGWIIFFVPGGLGVREGTLALLLAAMVSPAAGTVVALAARLWLTGAEGLLLLGIWIWARFVKGEQLSLIRSSSGSDGSTV